MEKEIKQTKAWLEEVIVKLNFCPFAKKELVNNRIHYHLSAKTQHFAALAELIEQCQLLEHDEKLETALIIYPQGFQCFDYYLELLDYANELLVDSGYEGIFQLASFHPDYCFENEAAEAAGNFTNRSPYPTIHIIREASLEKVLAHYPDPETIPVNNIAVANHYGAVYFEQLLANIRSRY